MMNDVLVRKVRGLISDVDRQENNKAGFVSEVIRDLLKEGDRLDEIEVALRKLGSRIFLLGLPMSEEEQARYTLFHPDPQVDDSAMRFYLWVGLNGPEEAASQLRSASLTAPMNLVNLRETGLLQLAADDVAQVDPDASLDELLEWLLLKAPSWMARRDVIRDHLDVLASDDSMQKLESLLEAVDLDVSTRAFVVTLRDLLRSASRDGHRLAFQSCEPMVLEAVLALLAAATWSVARDVYAEHEDLLAGDLAPELLMNQSQEVKYTVAERAVIHAHIAFLEQAWEAGIDAAIAQAEERFPEKYGTATSEDRLRAYLEAKDLESACDLLRRYAEEMLALEPGAIDIALRVADVEDAVERIGLIEDARQEGIDHAYRAWAELRSLADASRDDDETMTRLYWLVEHRRGCLRDRALELLLMRRAGAGDTDKERAIAQELVDTRSAGSRESRRPFDLVNLGIVCSKQGELSKARSLFVEARPAIEGLRKSSTRAILRTKIALFYRDYAKDAPSALHDFRVAVEEFRAADDRVSMAYAFEQLASVYRALDRVELAEVYTILAQQAMADLDGNEAGLVGAYDEVLYDVESGAVLTEILAGDAKAAAERADWLLGTLADALTEDQRMTLERLSLAAAIQLGALESARDAVSSWSARGQVDWSALGSAAIRLMEVNTALEGGARTAGSASRADSAMSGVGDALRRLGATGEGLDDLAGTHTPDQVASVVVDVLIGLSRLNDLDSMLPTRLIGDHEASSWVSQAQRSAAPATPRVSGPQRVPLAAGSPWSDIVERYADLGVWEFPDLAVYGPVLDRWALESRFAGDLRINQRSLVQGALDFYFFRSDPEKHLRGIEQTCVYIPDGDLILCSLPYLADLFNVGRANWDREFEKIRRGLSGSDWGEPVEDLANSLTDKLRARERVLLEWVLAHEIGHAESGHSAATTVEDTAILEHEADSFFLDGIRADDRIGEILMSLYGQLSLLYEYVCEAQLGRRPTPDEVAHRSIPLDASPDASGHRPIVFRAVSLIQSILRADPSLESTTYIDEFATSLGVT